MELQSFLPNTRYEILNLSGAVIGKGSLTDNKQQIDTKNLKKGSYLLKIINTNNTITITVVI